MVVGIGVNCAAHPADTDYPATDLAPGARVSPEELFGALSAKMLGRLAQWNAGRAFPPSAPTGSRAPPVSARMCACVFPTASSAGRFEALDEAGGLRSCACRRRVATIAAGDVFLRSAAPADMTR